MMFAKSTSLSIFFRFPAILFLSVGAFAQQAAPVSHSGVPQSTPAPLPRIPQAQPTPGLDPKTGIPIYETIQEDWSSLQIGRSVLEPEPPIASDIDVQANFTRQLVIVKWRPGDPIDLWIALPKGVKNPPVVLYLYGYREDTERFRDNAWCDRATSGGVAAVGFVSALTGHRFHDRPMRQWFVSELQESLGSTVHDVKFILDYLASRGDLDMTKVGMFGEGSGGAITILAAAADPRIKAIDLLEPWGDWPDFLRTSVVLQEDPDHDNYKKPEFIKKVETLDPVKWLPQLKIPIRMQQVKDDGAVSMEGKEALKNAAPKQTEVRRFETKLAMFHAERGGILFSWVKDRLNEIGRKSSVAEQKNPDQTSANARP
jgi:cephalosporin-C deacetylase-like acetyl esterase